MNTFTFDAEAVRQAVSMPDVIDAVRQGFIDFANGDFEMPLRTVLGEGGFVTMTAHHRPTRSLMVKTLSLEFQQRVPAIIGTVTWCDLGSTDQVIADAATITAMRTGAVSAVATDLMAPPDAATCTVIGAGGQAADQVRAVHAVRPLRAVTVIATDLRRAEKLADSLAVELDVSVAAGTDPDAGVEGAQIVCCATTTTEPLFRTDALDARAHVNAIGSYRPTMRELPADLLAEATVVVDDLTAARAEAGEIIHALRCGVLQDDDLSELGRALQDQARWSAPGRGRTVFKSVGIAVQDWATVNLLATGVTGYSVPA